MGQTDEPPSYSDAVRKDLYREADSTATGATRAHVITFIHATVRNVSPGEKRDTATLKKRISKVRDVISIAPDQDAQGFELALAERIQQLFASQTAYRDLYKHIAVTVDGHRITLNKTNFADTVALLKQKDATIEVHVAEPPRYGVEERRCVLQ